MIPVAAPAKGQKVEIETVKTDFALNSKANKRSAVARFYPNTIGTYRSPARLAKKQRQELRKALKINGT